MSSPWFEALLGLKYLESVTKLAQPLASASRLVDVVSPACIRYDIALSAMFITDANTTRFSTYCNARVINSGRIENELTSEFIPIRIILLTSLIPCLKDRDFNVDFMNDRDLILNNVINEICIERKDCNYFNIHTMFTNFILQGLSQQYYKYDGLHMSYSGITMVNKTLAISYKNL